MELKTCPSCNGNGLVSDMDPFGKETVYRCPDCGGYGYNKYKILPMRAKKTDKLIAWIVVVPERDFIKIEHSFENAVVWMDVHAANYYGKLEVA